MTTTLDDFRAARLKEETARRADPSHPLHPRRTPEAQADIAAARAAPTGFETAMQEIDRAAEQALEEFRNPPTHFRGPVPANVTAADLEATPGRPKDLDAALSNAALADTPAVREMGGPARCPTVARVIRGSIEAGRTPGGNITLDTTHTTGGLLRSLEPGRQHIEIERADLDDVIAALQVLAGTPPLGEVTPVLPPGSIVLAGPEAERYRAIAAAARKAQASAATARADGAALLQLFQAFCAGLAPGKDG